jgi:hypothetical protein
MPAADGGGGAADREADWRCAERDSCGAGGGCAAGAADAAKGVAAGAAADSATAAAHKEIAQPVRPPAPAFDPIKGSKQAQVVYEHVSDQIRRDPVQSTRLLKSWIGEAVEEKD